MIGIFDSGSGGLSTLKYLREHLPEYDYLYYGDYANCPYGDRSPDEIYQLTKAGVEKLFDAGCSLVIIACNTAITHAIRRLQSQDLPEKKILGVTITAGEKVQELGHTNIAVFATKGTVLARTYTNRMHIYNTDIQVQEIALSGLVEIIERHFDAKLWTVASEGRKEIAHFLQHNVPPLDQNNQAIILGCTHYSWIQGIIADLFPGVNIIDPSYEAAIKMKSYLSNHEEIEKTITKGGKVQYL